MNGHTVEKLPKGFDAGHDRGILEAGLGCLQRHEKAARRVVIIALFYLIPAVWILQPVISDNDVWWHLQTGKWITDHGTLPTTDPFSTYAEGKLWTVYSWLFEVSIYGLVRDWGESAVLFYTLGVTWLIMITLHLIIARRSPDFLMASGLLALSAGCLSKMFTPRPWLFTILFCAITLEVVLSFREGKIKPWFWCLPVIYVLWANTHIQFVYGLSLLGLAIIAPAIDRCLQPLIGMPPVMMCGSLMWRRLVALTALCVLGTFLTPYGGRLYSEVLLYAGQTGFWDVVQEMQAPPFRSAADWSMLMLFSVALIQLGRRKSLSSFEVLFFFAASISSFRGQRDVWFLVLAALTILAPVRIRERKEAMMSHRWLAPITVLILAGAVAILQYRGFSEAQTILNTGKLFPAGAASFIEREGYTGPLFNHFDWGGYLIWRLPELKVSMDGRGNLHGDTRIKQSISTWNGTSNWREDTDLQAAKVVIVQKNLALASLLQLDSTFKLVYKDDTALVFERASHRIECSPCVPESSKYTAVRSAE